MSVIQLPEGTVIAETGTAVIAVYYPYLKSARAIMAFDSSPLAHCLECKGEFYKGAHTIINHVRSHDRRKKVQRIAFAGLKVTP